MFNIQTNMWTELVFLTHDFGIKWILLKFLPWKYMFDIQRWSQGGRLPPPAHPKKKLFWFLILSFLFSVFKVRIVVGFFFFFFLIDSFWLLMKLWKMKYMYIYFILVFLIINGNHLSYLTCLLFLFFFLFKYIRYMCIKCIYLIQVLPPPQL